MQNGFNEAKISATKKFLFFQQRGIIVLKDEDGDPIIINGKELKISKFDFKDFNGFSDDEIIEIIKIDLGCDINTKDGLTELNDILFNAIKIYNRSGVKKIFDRKKVYIDNNFEFNNKEDILSFLKYAGEDNSRWNGKINCFISKICSGVNDALNTPGLTNLENNEKKVLKSLKNILALEDRGDNYIGYIGKHKFILYGRPKTIDSCVNKTLKDVEYHKLDKLKDGIGYTLEFDGNELDFLLLAEKISNVIISLGGEINKCKSKGIDVKKNLKNFKDGLPFKDNILKKCSYDKKNSTNSGYIDFKFLGIVLGSPIEIKIVPMGNKNQDGLNFQGIYSYLDKIIEGIIIRNIEYGYVKDEELKEIVILFFENLDDLIQENPEKKGTLTNDYLEELWGDLQFIGCIRDDIKYKNQKGQYKLINSFLVPGLVDYYKSKLVKVNIGKGLVGYSNERSIEISKQGFNIPLELSS